MSQERYPPVIEVPGPLRWKIARRIEGGRLTRKHRVTSHKKKIIDREGPVVSVSNHRNDSKDVKSVGVVLGDIRTPYFPAKSELDSFFKGWMMKGSGALFFDRDDADDRKRVYNAMREKLKEKRHVHIFVEETSKNRGRELGPMTSSPVLLAMEADLDHIDLVGIGGTEDPNSDHIHLQFAELPLGGLHSLVEFRRQLNEEGKNLTIKEAAIILAHTEDVDLISDEALVGIANPDPGQRRGQRRKKQKIQDPETTTADRLKLYQIFTEQVLRQKLQQVVEVSYDEAAV